MMRPIPKASWPFRLPIIRHVRAMIWMYRINKHYDFWLAQGSLPVNSHYDYDIVRRIRAGEI